MADQVGKEVGALPMNQDLFRVARAGPYASDECDARHVLVRSRAKYPNVTQDGARVFGSD